MKHIFNSLLNVATLSIAAVTFLLPSSVTAKENCFNDIKIEPGFVALTSSRESNLANWYKDLFNLEVVKTFGSGEQSTTGVLMKKGEFALEVFNKKHPVIPEQLKPKTPRSNWNGISKVGVYTNANLEELKSCLVNDGVKATRIFDDSNLNIKLLLVIDPENNYLEIISRKS